LTLDDKLKLLQERLGQLQRVAIAFSGGVDSTLLLKVACDVLGRENVVALTACTALVPRSEQLQARELADSLGACQVTLSDDILQLAAVAANPRDRCYHCKHHLFSRFRTALEELGFNHLLDGTNLDDLGEDRPGLRALAELGVESPLAACGLGKEEVRTLSRRFELPTADRPSFACLASRIPFGTPLTLENLARVERCEELLHELGFRNYRVRCHDRVARIELEEAEMPRLTDTTLRRELICRFKEYGFTYVTLDLQGFRSGSMSEVDA